MTALLVAAAAIAGMGAVAALAPVDVRVGLVGLTASLVGAALIADPLPAPAVMGIRLTALLLAVVTLRAAAGPVAPRGGGRGWSIRDAASDQSASHVGWPAGLLLGAAGATAGLAIASRLATILIGGTGAGRVPATVPVELLSPTSLAVGAAGLMLAIGLGPLLVEPTGLRRAIAAVVVVQAVILVRIALGPEPGVLEDVLLATFLVAVAAGGAALATTHRASLAAVAGDAFGAAGADGPVLSRPAPPTRSRR